MKCIFTGELFNQTKRSFDYLLTKNKKKDIIVTNLYFYKCLDGAYKKKDLLFRELPFGERQSKTCFRTLPGAVD